MIANVTFDFDEPCCVSRGVVTNLCDEGTVMRCLTEACDCGRTRFLFQGAAVIKKARRFKWVFARYWTTSLSNVPGNTPSIIHGSKAGDISSRLSNPDDTVARKISSMHVSIPILSILLVELGLAGVQWRSRHVWLRPDLMAIYELRRSLIPVEKTGTRISWLSRNAVTVLISGGRRSRR